MLSYSGLLLCLNPIRWRIGVLLFLIYPSIVLIPSILPSVFVYLPFLPRQLGGDVVRHRIPNFFVPVPLILHLRYILQMMFVLVLEFPFYRALYYRNFLHLNCLLLMKVFGLNHNN